jgi:hypothetical protein
MFTEMTERRRKGQRDGGKFQFIYDANLERFRPSDREMGSERDLKVFELFMAMNEPTYVEAFSLDSVESSS